MKIKRFNNVNDWNDPNAQIIAWGNKLKREFGLSKKVGFYDYEYRDNIDAESDETLIGSEIDYMFYFYIGSSPDALDLMARFFRSLYERGYNPVLSAARHDSMLRDAQPITLVTFTVPVYELDQRLNILRKTSQFDL